MIFTGKRLFAKQDSFVPTVFRFLDIGADILLLLLTLALILGILWSESSQAAGNESAIYEVDINNVQSGTLLYQLPDRVGQFAAPTVHTDVELTINGNIADVVMTQEFYNPTDQFIEGVYVFPIAHDAAVYGMRLLVDDRVIEGQIQEKNQAKTTYENAKKQGKRASLLQQLRPNLFTTNVANIASGETVRVVLQYQQKVALQSFVDKSYYELRIPAAITPRYTPSHSVDPLQKVSTTPPLGEDDVNAAINNYDKVNQELGNTLSVHAKITSEAMLTDIKSIGYPIMTSGPDNNQYDIAFPQTQSANKDFILRWSPEFSQAIQASLVKEVQGLEDYYLLSLLPPLQDVSGGHPLAREVTYIIDISGSMSGTPLQQAKQALSLAVSRLRAQDKFNIIKFSDDASAIFDQPVDAKPENLARAQNFIRGLDSEGGTEIKKALSLALGMNSSDGYISQIIFLTDGAINNEDETMLMIEKGLGNRRLFTIGIGSSPNTYFMTKAADYGRGVYTSISAVSDVNEKMSDLFRQLENPALTDIKVLASDGKLELSQQRVPDLYLGQPLILAIKGKQNQGGKINISGMLGDNQWQASVDISSASEGKGIARRWARNKIDTLMYGIYTKVAEGEVRAKVLPLALKHKLVTDYTSFVAVDVTPLRRESDKLNALSFDTNRPVSDIALATTATSAPLQMAIGLALLLFASLMSLPRRAAARHADRG